MPMSTYRRVLLAVSAILFAIVQVGAATAQTDSEDSCLSAAPAFEFIARIERGAMRDMEVSPDGTLLAVASSRGVWLYDALTLDLESTLLLPDEAGASTVSWSPEANTLAAGYADGIRIWNVEHQEVVWAYSKIPDVTHIDWSPDGALLAIL